MLPEDDRMEASGRTKFLAHGQRAEENEGTGFHNLRRGHVPSDLRTSHSSCPKVSTTALRTKPLTHAYRGDVQHPKENPLDCLIFVLNHERIKYMQVDVCSHLFK
jgi:hypothetical protein